MTHSIRTSETHPLEIAAVRADEGMGLVGLTFAPGKQQAVAMTGAWKRDLALDLDVVAAWNAAAVVTLVEDYELDDLQITPLGEEVRARHMAWVHAPIRDYGVPGPAFEQTWANIGPGLRARVRDGANVLVHCKGGLGRAGTIAARLLVELGIEPGSAVDQIRAARPGAIETTAQLDHVLTCSPIMEPAPDRGPEAVRDRAVGALLGLAVGDAVGTTLEFRPRDSYFPLTDMVGGGPFRLQPGHWTDDTAMALALATSLIERCCLEEADLMERFVAWHEQGEYSCTGTCFDIGMTVSSALGRYQQTGDPRAGSTDPRSAGNGSLMRLAPVAIRYWQDRAALRDAAIRQSVTTHAAAEAVDACAAYAEILADAIGGLPRHEVMRRRAGDFAGSISAIIAGSWRDLHRDAVRGSGYVVHSLEAALWCIGRTSNFAEAVLLAANLGEDADTTAAITGQLAGALYGKQGIPQVWLDRLAWSDRIETLALELITPYGW